MVGAWKDETYACQGYFFFYKKQFYWNSIVFNQIVYHSLFFVAEKSLKKPQNKWLTLYWLDAVDFPLMHSREFHWKLR